MVKRRRLMNSTNNVLPDGYQRVEYIQGQQSGRTFSYIKLEDIDPNSTYRIEFGFIPSDISRERTCVVGRVSTSENKYMMFFGRWSYLYAWNCGTSRDYRTINYNLNSNTEYKIEVLYSKNYQSLKIDDTEIESGAIWNQERDMAMCLMASPDSNDYSYASLDKITFCKVWKNNMLIHDLVPCYQKSSGVVGMYDFISSSLRSAIGGRAFLKGADI